jgi:hypothetical protein
MRLPRWTEMRLPRGSKKRLPRGTEMGYSLLERLASFHGRPLGRWVLEFSQSEPFMEFRRCFSSQRSWCTAGTRDLSASPRCQVSRALPVLRSLLPHVFGASNRLPASIFDQKRRYYSISGPQYAAHSAPHVGSRKTSKARVGAEGPRKSITEGRQARGDGSRSLPRP